jgi:multidrug resistance efflux pump
MFLSELAKKTYRTLISVRILHSYKEIGVMNSSYPKATTAAVDPVLEHSGRSAFQFSNRRQHVGATSTAVSATVTPPVGSASKHRPRGRGLIAVLMIAACSTGAFTVWDSLFRYQAYGVVTGRIIDVSVPMDGVLKTVLVREGDSVRQDAQLAKVVDLEFEQQLARVTDELRITEATLQAEIAKVQWQSRVDDTEMTKSIAELYESTGRLQQENGSLDLLRDQLTRTKKTASAGRLIKPEFELVYDSGSG